MQTTWFTLPVLSILSAVVPVPIDGEIVVSDGSPSALVTGVAEVAAASSTSLGEAPRLQGIVAVLVTDQRTSQPLAGAQISIDGTNLGGLAGADGRATISGVPAGEYQLRVQRIGFRTVVRTITVTSGQMTTVAVTMAEEALSLDEIVVTGTAGGTQRRAVGNVVGRISAAEITEVAPVANVQQLIGGRTAGVSILSGAGQVGSGQRIRIRGAGSMALDNDPIIYIDGIRMESAPNRGPSQRGGANVSRLNDIDPESIESIEIIKGPAAATLYGTEASNGVIQIITKRGAAGAPTLDVTVTGGANWLWDPAGRAGMVYGQDPVTGEIIGLNLYEHEREHGKGDLFTYGGIQTYSASLRGGTDAVRYALTGSWSDQTGAVDWNWEKRLSGRANIDILPTETVTLRASLGFVEGKRRLAQNDLTSDPFGNLYWGIPSRLETTRGFDVAPPEELRKVENRSDVDRFTVSFEAAHRPTDWLTHRLMTGIDSNQEFNHRLYPRMPEGSDHFFGNLGLGNKQTSRIQRRLVSLDYSASARLPVTNEVQSETSVGLQYYRTQTINIGATGSEFPALPITTVTGGATRTGTESFSENATVGVYVQEQVEWRNRVFFTAAIRLDDNSAFGAEFDAAVYPKVSATWVMHEEPFWNVGWLSQFRARAAFGAAGQQPGTFDASRLYSPQIGYNDEPGLVPSAYGNPQLKPEKGEEIEVGFDAELLDGRLSLIYTRFDRWTRDAIVNRGIARSEGFPGTQVVNLGLIRGWGNELSVDIRAIETPRFGWNIGFHLANFKNRIEDLGGDEAIFAGITQHRQGFSIADIYLKKVLSAEITETGAIVPGTLMCDGGTGHHGVEMGGSPVACDDAPAVRWGHSQPTWELGISNSINVGRFRFYAQIDAAGGHMHENASVGAAITSVGNTKMSLERKDPIFQAYRTVNREPLGLYDASFARLREVSATYSLPDRIARYAAGAKRGSITVAARNLAMIWTGQDGWRTARSGMITPTIGDGRIWDPETRGSANLSASSQTVMPPLASAQLTVRLGF